MTFTYWQMVWFAALVALPVLALGMVIGEALPDRTTKPPSQIPEKEKP